MSSNGNAPVAYTAQEFPSLTMTFVYREVAGLRARGVPVKVFSTWKPRPEALAPEARDLMDGTFYVFPLHWPRFLWAHALFLGTRLRRYLGTLLFLLRQPAPGLRGRLRFLYHFGEAVYLARVMEQQGVRHIHGSFASNPASLALLISRLSGIPFSFAAHANDVYADRVLLEEKLAAARFVISSTQYNDDHLARAFPGASAGKIRVIHHGVSLKSFPVSDDAAEGPPLLLAVAQFREKKGLPFLVQACAQLKLEGVTFRCSLIGDGPQRPLLESLIRQHGLDHLLRLEGIVFQEALRGWYRRAAVLTLPSVVAADGDRDGIPVTLIEAMASGLPVVSTSVSGIPEIVEHERTGLLVPPGDAHALAGALRRLLCDAALRRRMGQASREKIEREFDLDRNLDVVAELFRLGAERDFA